MHIRKLLPFALLLVAMSTVCGQDLPKKVAVIDDSSSYEEFVRAFEGFVGKLSTASNDVRGFIALSSMPGEIMLRYKFIRSRMREDKNLRKRLEVTTPGIKYRGGWKGTEFWFLAKRAASPYTQLTADYSCPLLEILGYATIGTEVTKVTYTVSYPESNWLDTPYTFKWAVNGGKIVDGQGTTKITVERHLNGEDPIIVSIEIAGGDEEDEDCIRSASITTIIEPKPVPRIEY